MTTSLTVPVYNEVQYLPKCIDSIRQSTLQPDEILFCDNGSTDKSIQVISQLTKNLPVHIIKERTKGILAVVNRTWQESSGDIILKIDADSTLPTKWIENAVVHFEKDAELAACTGPILPGDGSDMDKKVLENAYKFALWSYEKIKGFPLLSGPNSAFRRQVLVEIQGYTWPKYDVDDQLISKKMHTFGKKTAFFGDMYLYHSTRRYQNRPEAYVETLLSIVNPRYYTEKNI